MTAFAMVETRALRGVARHQAARTFEAEPVIAAAFCGFLGLVCLRRGIEPRDVWRQLARRGRGRNAFAGDAAWRDASEARAIAIYLVNTLANVPGALIARAIGIEAATVCVALRRIEGRRESKAFEAELIALEWMATGGRA
jgi:hypothetical protein